MMGIPSARCLAFHGLAMAGVLVVGPGASEPLDAQEPLAPPLTVQQPAQPPPHAKPAKGQAAAGADDQPGIRQQRARLVEQREATLRNEAERRLKRAGLFEQRKATLRAEADYHTARLARALAEIAVEEYEQIAFEQDRAEVDGEVLLAKSDLSRAEDRVEWARRMFDKGFVNIAQKASEELALKKARFGLEQAQSKRKVLVDYTKGKTIKELGSALEKARSVELDKQQLWLRAKTDETELRRRIGVD
ncbi:MAG: hypothetical protein ACLQIB_17825 [Isosphaeraceae bacterium]